MAEAGTAHFVLDRRGVTAGFVVLMDVANPNGAVELRRLVMWHAYDVVWRAAISAVLRLCFRDWCVDRIWFNPTTLEPALVGLLTDMGFGFEGRQEHSTQFEQGHVQRVMSMLSSEYERFATFNDFQR